MQIHKILNNNVAIILDAQGQESVVMGRGLCFGKKAGSKLNPEQIEKIFALESPAARERYANIAQEVHPVSVLAAEHVISKAENTLGKRLNENIHVSLTDHIQFALTRFERGLALKNAMLWDIRRMYPEEFRLGMHALDIIEEHKGIRLPDDESAYIAMHLVSAELDGSLSEVADITKIVTDCIQIIVHHFKMTLDTESLSFYRLLTHLKFFAQRLLQHHLYEDSDDDSFYVLIRHKYKEAYACVQRIAHYAVSIYDIALTHEELLYLTIHIERILRSREEEKDKRKSHL